MCHKEDFKLEITKGQALTDTELGKIEAKLDEDWNASQIARYLDRDDSGIRKEIRNFSFIKKISINYDKKCSNCKNYTKCRDKKLCNGGCYSRTCKGCNIAPNVCEEYIPLVLCKHLKGKRIVCNGCPIKAKCNKPKLIYSSRYSTQKHATNKQNCIKKEKIITEPDLKNLLDKIVPLIKDGISPEVALNGISRKYKVIISVPTLYEYIDKQLIDCSNIDLRNKVKRKPKSEKRIPSDKRKHRDNGRSYDDLEDSSKGTGVFGSVEMDTVEGVKGGKLLLTLIEKHTKFLFGIPIESKHQVSIIEKLDKLEELLKDKFVVLFKTILTDNGCEFLDFEGIEEGINGTKRTSLYYANPYASYQKGTIENQHRLIRYFYPKGKDFSNYTDANIIKQINKINNYPRKRLNWKSPYEVMVEEVGVELLDLLGFYYIPLEKLNMKNTA